jgi:hypothetical protein
MSSLILQQESRIGAAVTPRGRSWTCQLLFCHTVEVCVAVTCSHSLVIRATVESLSSPLRSYIWGKRAPIFRQAVPYQRGPSRTRTDNILLAKQALYQLELWAHIPDLQSAGPLSPATEVDWVRLDLHEEVVVTSSADPVLRVVAVDIFRERVCVTTHRAIAREVILTRSDRADLFAKLTPTVQVHLAS